MFKPELLIFSTPTCFSIGGSYLSQLYQHVFNCSSKIRQKQDSSLIAFFLSSLIHQRVLITIGFICKIHPSSIYLSLALLLLSFSWLSPLAHMVARASSPISRTLEASSFQIQSIDPQWPECSSENVSQTMSFCEHNVDCLQVFSASVAPSCV